MASVRYLFIAVTLWCVGLDIKLLLYRPLTGRNNVNPLLRDESLEVLRFQARPKINYGEIRERNIQRIKELKKSCEVLGFSNFSDESLYFTGVNRLRAHIDPHLNVLFCRINKCGSTLSLEILKRVFQCDTGCLISTAMNVKQSPQLAWKVMKNAFSFVTVREPYGRIFSSYSNLFYLPKEDWLSRGVKIIRQVRGNASTESLTYGHDLTFVELVKYIVHNYESGTYIDPHVRPMHHSSCNPCAYNFNYLAKLETLSSDLEYMLHEWRERHYIDDYPENLVTDVKDWTVWGPIKHFISTVNLTRDSSIPLRKMFERTWTYYQMKGIVSKHIDMPFRNSELWFVDFNIFKRVLSNAMILSEANKNSVQNQRMEAMKQAYATVPMEYMERLSKVVKTDCILFGYDDRPAYLFDRSKSEKSDNFDYFKGL